MTLVVRSEDAAAAATPLRREMAAVDPNLPLTDVATLDDYVTDRAWHQQVAAAVIGFFALSGLFLAALGTRGLIAYSVAQRTYEIGVRMALGAKVPEILATVMGWGLLLVGLGIGLGLAGAAALTRLLRSLLVDVSASDPWTFLWVALVLLVVSLAATYLPARRATRVDPIVALRSS
jgi:putative ABC transport system permease protein